MKAKTEMKSSRVSKAQWLARALEVLASEGVDGVRIERLARDLGVAKSGFYWHFRDRPDLLKQMLAYWDEEFTESVLIDPKSRQGNAADRLYRVMEMVEEGELAKYDLAIRSWAERDPLAKRSIRRVYRRRLAFAEEIFRELGFRGQELEMRVQSFLGYHTWQQAMYFDVPKAKQRALRKLRWKMFVRE